MRRNLLIVSESGQVRESLATRLRRDGYSVTLVATGAEAARVVRNVAVDAVLIESLQADARARRLRARLQRERPGCRVVLVSSFAEVRRHSDLLRFGADDYVLGADQLLALLRPLGEGVDPSASPLATRMIQSLVATLDVTVGLLELDDRFFRGSSHQVMRLARAVASEIATDDDVIHEVVLGALLKDVGKAGVETEVLEEKGEFSAEQHDLMQEHVEGSVRLLEHVDFPWKVIPVIRHHHERYDGQGYPDGLRGREIPIGARILAVADAWVAMTGERVHRQPMDPRTALAEIERNAGTQFDPEVVEIFLQVLDRHRGSVGGGKHRVLLVDDQREFRRLLKMKLLNEGFDVSLIGSPERALPKIKRRPPRLVIAATGSDPHSALNLMQRMRDEDDLRDIPFALLADNDDRILKVRALRHGVDDFLVRTGDLEELVARVENIVVRELSRRSDRQARKRGVSGQLENMPLPDIVQTLSIGMKTGCVTLTAGDASGEIWFQDGKIKHAVCEGLEGEGAFYRMLRWQDGEFVIQHGVDQVKATIEADSMWLVLEGLRQLDQDKAVGEGAAAAEAT